MTEIWFYHLENRPLDQVLPNLLQRSLDRGWRACVQAGSEERVQALDATLWTFDEASFLPHGTAKDGDPATQPILLTDREDNLNAASVRFVIDSAPVAPALAEADYERVVLLFDGGDDDALANARTQWSTLKKAGHAVTYWQQNGDGRWEKRA